MLLFVLSPSSFMAFNYSSLFSDKFDEPWMFCSVGTFYVFDGCNCIECFEQLCVKLTGSFFDGCVFVEFRGGVTFCARLGLVIFVLSLISLVSMGYFCLFILMSTETIQWFETYPCSVVLMTLKPLLSCVKIRSRVFPLTCVGRRVVAVQDHVLFMVLLKMTAYAFVMSSMWILKSLNMILSWY